MAEKAKRLVPTPETLRELYLKSGNLCAFPGCNEVMMDAEGDFIGQICHIEAAEEGGERFNPTMTNDQRRGASNLMLMCYKHHKKTDNVMKFPVDKLREMKNDHEAKFVNIEQKMLDRIRGVTDHTKILKASPPTSLAVISRKLKWQLSKRERLNRAAALADMVRRLEKVPVPTRQLMQVIVERAEWDRYDTPHALFNEVRDACGLSKLQFAGHLKTLVKYKLISEPDFDESYLPNLYPSSIWAEDIGEVSDYGGWYVWDDIRKFCDEHDIDLASFVVRLQFDQLD